MIVRCWQCQSEISIHSNYRCIDVHRCIYLCASCNKTHAPNHVTPRASSRESRTPAPMTRHSAPPYLDPFIRDLQRRLATAESVNQAYAALRAGLVALEALPRAGIPIGMIIESLGQVNQYNRARMFSTFRAALGVDIRPFLADATVSAHMVERIADNVQLVKTIPPRLHANLRVAIETEFRIAPFDRQALQEVLQKEFGSSGYNLRRLTRDQSSKMNADLSRMRHQQLGVTHYTWRTSEDERVRPTHADNNGKVFAYTDPPATTGNPGNDVQCRCLSEPVLTPPNRQRLGATR